MSNTEKFLQTVSPNLEKYALAGNFDNFKKSVFIAISQSADLEKIIATPKGQESVYNALRTAATNGLSLNPADGKAAIIGYNSKNGPVVNYQIMKDGLVELAMRSGNVEWIRSEIVKENDEFDPPANPDEKVYYKPARKNRGVIDGFFAEMKLKNGSIMFKYMSVDEIEAHRKKYSEKSFMPEEAYGEKTVLKRLLNRSKLSDADFTDKEFYSDNGVSSDEALEKLNEKENVIETTATVEPVQNGNDDDSLI